MSQPRGQVFSGTLVLIAPKNARPDEVEAFAVKARETHKGPIIVLPNGWKAMDGAELRKMLGDVGGKPDTSASEPRSLGTSKPPPPPPPPT